MTLTATMKKVANSDAVEGFDFLTTRFAEKRQPSALRAAKQRAPIWAKSSEHKFGKHHDCKPRGRKGGAAQGRQGTGPRRTSAWRRPLPSSCGILDTATSQLHGGATTKL